MGKKTRIKGRYERFRLREGKDDDLYDAIDKCVNDTKIDFADIARAALRAYLLHSTASDTMCCAGPATHAVSQQQDKNVIDSNVYISKTESSNTIDLDAKLDLILSD